MSLSQGNEARRVQQERSAKLQDVNGVTWVCEGHLERPVQHALRDVLQAVYQPLDLDRCGAFFIPLRVYCPPMIPVDAAIERSNAATCLSSSSSGRCNSLSTG